jgi:pimeloyl-ACP methyl ester carboxylesterase
MTTQAMRLFLRDRGYHVYGWKMGRNVGYRPGMRAMLNQRLHYIEQRNSRKVSLIGWSLGGTYARQMAADMPDAVRQVVTLGTPTHGDPMSGHAWRLYEALSGQTLDELRRQLAGLKPITQPLTALYSRTDGLVPWQRCRQPVADYVENIEINSSHYGLGHHPLALYVVADRLAQREGEWAPFDRPDWFCNTAFPDPERDAA